MIIFLTGATGFVGNALVDNLGRDSKYSLRASVRCSNHCLPPSVSVFQTGDISLPIDWSVSLKNVDVVIHAAARTHILNETFPDPLAEFRKINVEGTLHLARQAALAGVNRFIFISSIGVNGNENSHPFNETHTPKPVGSYAVSKFEAELGLKKIAIETGMELVIIRPPLIYGPNAPGNFSRLLHAVDKGVPLPLGAIHNRRSFVGIDNFVNLIATCIDHPAAENQIFLAADGEDLSTTELLKRLYSALRKPVRLIFVPQFLLAFGLNILGKGNVAQKLCGSLQVDISKTRKLLGWKPPVSVDEGLKKTAEWYLRQKI